MIAKLQKLGLQFVFYSGPFDISMSANSPSTDD